MIAPLSLSQAAPAADAAKPAAETIAVPSAADVAQAVTNPIGTLENATDVAIRLTLERGPTVLMAITVLVISWLVAGWLRRLVIRASTRAHIELTLSKFFGNIIRWAVIVFGAIACLGTFGISTTSFAAVLGAAGLAIGLALQGNLGNLASGVLLLIFRPFKIGDAVIVAGQAGVVDGIDLFTTNLDTPDNRRIIVPNGAIFSGVIENQTRHPTRQVTVSTPISGSVDPDDARRVLRGAAERVLERGIGALPTPPPAATLAEITPGTIYSVGLWAETAKVPAVRQALLEEIKRAVETADIAPGPTVMNVHVRSMPGQ